MTVTLLSLMQDVADEVGIPRPSSVISSTDDSVRRLLAMMNREGRDLVRVHHWTVLQKLHTFTTIASQEEYSLPSDYSRLIPDTEWDRSNDRPLIGPINTQTWEAIKSSGLGTGIAFSRFRIVKSANSLAKVIYLEPTPSSTGLTMAFWYISNNWCADTGKTTGQDAWAADTDEPLVDADLLRLGTIVRFKRSMGFEYASEADEYFTLLQTLKGQDRPSPTVNLAAEASYRLIGIDNVPETGYGS